MVWNKWINGKHHARYQIMPIPFGLIFFRYSACLLTFAQIKIYPMRKFFFFFILIILLVGAGVFYWRYYYVFGEGVKAGELNFMVRKGILFKTYEGRLIQTGYKSVVPGSVQSNEFDFSVENEKIAQTLMVSGGKLVELHYREFFGSVPWRGNSKYIVDSIIDLKEKNPTPGGTYP